MRSRAGGIIFTEVRGHVMDWTNCREVESVPGKLSGSFVVKGTRIPADGILENAADGFTAEEIATEIYDGLPVEQARRIIEFAEKQRLSIAT